MKGDVMCMRYERDVEGNLDFSRYKMKTYKAESIHSSIDIERTQDGKLSLQIDKMDAEYYDLILILDEGEYISEDYDKACLKLKNEIEKRKER